MVSAGIRVFGPPGGGGNSGGGTGAGTGTSGIPATAGSPCAALHPVNAIAVPAATIDNIWRLSITQPRSPDEPCYRKTLTDVAIQGGLYRWAAFVGGTATQHAIRGPPPITAPTREILTRWER
ncbi:hypothetical protein FMUAM8_56240 [Nocardia cyriacigeorgica]|nr:hypothetical protein FMUAM8_56240 [Nocardia cyriacigeorgica]